MNPQAERAALIEELAVLRQKKEQLKAEIDKYRECDPDVIEEMRKLYIVQSELLHFFSLKSGMRR